MRVFSLFQSIDGEVNHWGQGIPSTFLRLSGCVLSCSYCDIPEAQDPKAGLEISVDELVQSIREMGCPKITITGGEPLLQEEELHRLLNRLFPFNYRISIETNGTLPLNRFRNLTKPSQNVCLVVDWKFDHPPKDLSTLADWDWVKFVIGSREEYEEAKYILDFLNTQASIAFSPIHETLPGKTLVDWMLTDKLWNITLNCQIHKYLGLA